MIFEMRQLATRITPNLGNHNRKIDQTTVRFSSVLWIFSVHRTEPANTTWTVSSKQIENMAQFRPSASSLGTNEGRVSLREVVVTDIVAACEGYTVNRQGAWGPITCKIS